MSSPVTETEMTAIVHRAVRRHLGSAPVRPPYLPASFEIVLDAKRQIFKITIEEVTHGFAS